MARFLAEQLIPCEECGHDKSGNFRYEERFSVYESGSVEEKNYSRYQMANARVIVCVKCGAEQTKLK